MYAVLCQQHRTWILCLRCLRFDLNVNMSAYMHCIRTLLHEFALTYNTIEKLVSMFGALTRGRAPSSGKSLQSRELPPSQQWDEIRSRVSRRGGGGIMANSRGTLEVSWLCIYIIRINHTFKIIGFTCKCVEIKKCMTNLVYGNRTFHTSARYETSLLFFNHYSFVFIQPLTAFILAIKRLPRLIASIPVYIYPTIIKSISK